MPIDFILINTDLGKEEEVAKELKDVQNVSEVFLVYGSYDIVAKIQAESMDGLNDTIASKIRPIENIRSISSLMIEE
jgi:DNA-binding Lrp family transcriptional regulator